MAGLLLLAVSAVLLAGGAELFAEHAGAAGRRLGVSALAIGLVLAGAEPEELVTATVASARHHPGIAAGDAIGANVTMLTLVLGLAAFARPLPLTRRVRFYALAASVAGIAAALALLGGGIGRAGGALLTACYILGVAAVWRAERRPPAFGEAAELEEEAGRLGEGGEAAGEGGPGQSARRGTRAALLVVAGVAAMAVGGWLAVAGAERIVVSLGLAESVVGLSLVALATTAELFALVWAAARRGVDELALAGVLGSATYNATATLGVAALVRPLTVSGVQGQAWLAAALPAALVSWALMFKGLGRIAGVVLVATYGLYLAVTFS